MSKYLYSFVVTSCKNRQSSMLKIIKTFAVLNMVGAMSCHYKCSRKSDKTFLLIAIKYVFRKRNLWKCGPIKNKTYLCCTKTLENSYFLSIYFSLIHSTILQNPYSVCQSCRLFFANGSLPLRQFGVRSQYGINILSTFTSVKTSKSFFCWLADFLL